MWGEFKPRRLGVLEGAVVGQDVQSIEHHAVAGRRFSFLAYGKLANNAVKKAYEIIARERLIQ